MTFSTSIDGEFTGWSPDQVFIFQDGRAFQQTDATYSYSYSYCPPAEVRNGFMVVQGMSGSVPVRAVSMNSSRISGESVGLEGYTKFELENGQVWEQVNYKYKYRYKYRPRAWIVDGGYIKIEGIEDVVRVRRVR